MYIYIILLVSEYNLRGKKSKKTTMIVTISGRSGSGKTTVVNKLINILGKENVCCLNLDSYYKDQSHIACEEREKINFDHPDSIEVDFFAFHLKRLSAGWSVEKPIYDFVTHTRSTITEKIIPRNIILADGIHALTYQIIRDIADLKVFIDTDADISFIRRLLRDTKERGRSVESVINQYLETVRPMQEKYIVPTKQYADFIITGGGYNQTAINQLVELISRRNKK